MLFKVSHHYTLKNSTVNTLTSLLNGNLKAIRYLQKIYLKDKYVLVHPLTLKYLNLLSYYKLQIPIVDDQCRQNEGKI